MIQERARMQHLETIILQPLSLKSILRSQTQWVPGTNDSEFLGMVDVLFFCHFCLDCSYRRDTLVSLHVGSSRWNVIHDDDRYLVAKNESLSDDALRWAKS